ncbi:HD domain-containing protein [Bacillaceae bacterium SIJ1]|uniref:HD domain-containing protein n=1 Tax=Litoribacterium kuwaitense TaxID=1398745 RepID=UPI0013ED143A|nr:HD domain-containing protein [Litoribacterium kuwaitense]NGP46527.1 HD domain-containing protein [Litoribacterium kuwaitense]
MQNMIIPDSKIAKEATQLIYDISPEFLYNHCLRTYAFGDVLGQQYGLKYDLELFYLASVLHDIGLTEHVCCRQSFEYEGADHAEKFLRSHGFSQDKIDVVREAIILHTSEIAEEKQPEVALVHFGAGMDIMGLRAKDIPEDAFHFIIEAYPRLGFKQAIIELIQHDATLKEAEQQPNNLSSSMLSVGFVDWVMNAPFQE